MTSSELGPTRFVPSAGDHPEHKHDHTGTESDTQSPIELSQAGPSPCAHVSLVFPPCPNHSFDRQVRSLLRQNVPQCVHNSVICYRPFLHARLQSLSPSSYLHLKSTSHRLKGSRG